MIGIGSISSHYVANTAFDYINRSFVQNARNGTTTQSFTISPTPTSGYFLVGIGFGAVTFSTPSGWTSRASAVNSGGLYVFTKTSAGNETVFTTTHNGSNYPSIMAFYQFPSGTTWVNATTSNTGSIGSANNPALTGLTGNNYVFSVMAAGLNTGSGTNTVAWTSPYALEYNATPVGLSGTDGYHFSLGVNKSVTTSSTTPANTGSFSGTSSEAERITFAVKGP